MEEFMPYIRIANRQWLAEHADYVNEGPTGWRCKTTPTLIAVIPTDRTIWDGDGPGHCASSQGVQTVVEIYCPRCCEVPKVTPGTPIMAEELMTV